MERVRPAPKIALGLDGVMTDGLLQLGRSGVRGRYARLSVLASVPGAQRPKWLGDSTVPCPTRDLYLICAACMRLSVLASTPSFTAAKMARDSMDL